MSEVSSFTAPDELDDENSEEVPIFSAEQRELLELIQHKEQQIDHDLLDPKHYVNDLLSESPKKNFYNTWADLLELKYNVLGTPEEIPRIANVIRRKLISLNKENQVNWMYEVLRGKYKQHRPNYNEETYGEPTKNSSPNINYEAENAPFIEMLERHIRAVETIKSKLKSVRFLGKEDKNGELSLDPGRIRSDIDIVDAADNLMLDVWDNRKDVSVYTQHFLVAMVMRYNTGYATGAYLGYIKDFGASAMHKSIEKLDALLSPKQVGKIMRGLTKELHERYDPKNREDSQVMGFYGDQCDNAKCESWRVTYDSIYNSRTKMLEKKCKCHACNNTWIPKLDILPGARK